MNPYFRFPTGSVCAAALIASFTTHAHATILVAPLVTNSAPPFNASFDAANTVDGLVAEYASAGQGTNTFVEYSFGAPATFDSIVVINRDSPGQSDLIGNFTVVYDGGPSSAVTRTPLRGTSQLHSLGGNVTATIARLNVNTIGTGDANNNTGAMEVIFVNRPDGMLPISGISIFGSAPAFSPSFSATNAIDGDIGRISVAGDSPEYASASLGLDAFVEFDLGAITPVAAFDWFDRPHQADRVTGFDMIFSQDTTFGNGDDVTRSYTNSAMATGDVFSAINARYVRYDVTGMAGGLNTGLSEIYFYQVPEPSAAALLLAGLAAVVRRRRK